MKRFKTFSIEKDLTDFEEDLIGKEKEPKDKSDSKEEKKEEKDENF